MEMKYIAMKKLVFYIILLLLPCLVWLFLNLNHNPRLEILSEEHMKCYDLRNAKIYVPCEILPNDWSPNGGNVGKTVEHIANQDQVINPDQHSIIDRTTMNLHLVSPVPTDNQSIVDQYISFVMGGFGKTNNLVSANLEYCISDSETISLVLSSCIWAPSDNDVFVGLYSMESEMCYAYPLSRGIINNTVLTFPNLPKGFYRLYVASEAPGALSSGQFYGKIIIEP